MSITRIFFLIAAFLIVQSAPAGVAFSVTVAERAATAPVSGRLVVSLIREGSRHGHAEPNDAPFWEDQQPMFATDVQAIAPGTTVALGEGADFNVVSAAALPAGTYRAQARLITTRTRSSWRNDAGNLYGPVRTFELKDGASVGVTLSLDSATAERTWPATPGVELVEVRSELLSKFRGREVILRAGVVLPAGYDASKQYAAVYEVPGYGGDHFMALGMVHERQSQKDARAKGTFWVYLDPESEYGHTLFADSENTGPCGRALVEELIPAIEAKFPLIRGAKGRLLRGHSSGGWSVIWLAMQYPEVFGAAWSSSPDPVDLRRFETADIYADANMYTDKDGAERPAYVVNGRTEMNVRQENAGERMLGALNMSAQQWASWQAVWGPRDRTGRPASLYDERTGAIDRAIAERYRSYDISYLVRTQPEKYAGAFFDRIHILVGGADNFFLHEAVGLLRGELVKAAPGITAAEGRSPLITVVPGRDHFTIYGTPEMRDFDRQMVEYLGLK